MQPEKQPGQLLSTGIDSPIENPATVNAMVAQTKGELVGALYGPIGNVWLVEGRLVLELQDPKPSLEDLQHLAGDLSAELGQMQNVFDENQNRHSLNGPLTDEKRLATAHAVRSRSNHVFDLKFMPYFVQKAIERIIRKRQPKIPE